MERIVIVAYSPKPGKAEALKTLMTTHWETLNHQGLVSGRKPIIVESKNGTVIEIFGWKSKEAMARAHQDDVVQELWEEYEEVCEYVPIGDLPECHQLFSEFTPLN